jgi:hypothetical protein
MIATQKTFTCSANSILAVAGVDKMSMALGDPSILELLPKQGKYLVSAVTSSIIKTLDSRLKCIVKC